MTQRTHAFSEETGVRIAEAVEQIAFGTGVPKKDDATGRYTNLGGWLASQRNGAIYGVQIPKYSGSTTVECVKTGANSGLSVTPSTASTAGADDYRAHFPFKVWDVVGGADDDGTPFVKSMADYDASYVNNGALGNVFVMAPTLYWRYTEQAACYLLEICDTPKAGFEPQPGAKLPDGTIRPFMLYAKYPGGTYNGKLASVSGVQVRNRNVSHNTGMTLAAAVGAGYSCLSPADDWYRKVMFLLMFAKKSSQAIFSGCTGYTAQSPVTVAETGVKRVILSNTEAAKYDVGSSIMYGSAPSAQDRNAAAAYSVFDAATILYKEAYDSGNTALYVDTASTFDTTVGTYVSTAPWRCGSLDRVQGTTGTITDAGRTNGHEPFLLQGIECMVGVYEVMGGVILNATSEPSVEVWRVYDTSKDATSLTSDFVKVGELDATATAGWLYQEDIANMGGMLLGVGHGANSGTGTGDATYQNAATSQGLREFLGVGALHYGAVAGLFCVYSDTALSDARWYFGSRLSATGRAAA